jgi:hypothetical protein
VSHEVVERRIEHKYLAHSSLGWDAESGAHGLVRAHSPRIVHSLYFDSPDGASFRESEEGLSERWKVRVRWYGGERSIEGAVPLRRAGLEGAFLEVKARAGALVLKSRAPLSPDDALHLVGGSVLSVDHLVRAFQADEASRGVQGAISAVAARGALLPRVHLHYLRHYFVHSPTGLRATLDSCLRARLAGPPMARGGVELLPRGRILLELKGPSGHETRVSAVSATLGLRRTRYSKYCEAMRRLLLVVWVCGFAWWARPSEVNADNRQGSATPAAMPLPTNAGQAALPASQATKVTCPPAEPIAWEALRLAPESPLALRDAFSAARAYLARAREDCLSGAQPDAAAYVEALAKVRGLFPPSHRFGRALWSSAAPRGSDFSSLARVFAQERLACAHDCLLAEVLGDHARSPAFAIAFEEELLAPRSSARATTRVASFPRPLLEALLERRWDARRAQGLCKSARSAVKFSSLTMGATEAGGEGAPTPSGAEELAAGLVAFATHACLGVAKPDEGLEWARSLLGALAPVTARVDRVGSSSPDRLAPQERGSSETQRPRDGQPRLEDALGRSLSFYDALAAARLRREFPRASTYAPEAFVENIDTLLFAPRWRAATKAACDAGAAGRAWVAAAAFTENFFPLDKLEGASSSAFLLRELRDDAAALALRDPRYGDLKEVVHNALGPQAVGLADLAPAPHDAQTRVLLARIRSHLARLFPSSARAKSGAQPEVQSPLAVLEMTRLAADEVVARDAQARAALALVCKAQDTSSVPWSSARERAYWKAEVARFNAFQHLSSTLTQWEANAFPPAEIDATLWRVLATFSSGRGTALEGMLAEQERLSRRLQKGVVQVALAATNSAARSVLAGLADVARPDAMLVRNDLVRAATWHEQVLRASNVQTLVGFLERVEEGRSRVRALVGDAVEGTPTGALSWRAMNPGDARGRLVFVTASKLARHPYASDEILVTDALPLDLGHTAGVITEVAQPRLSHIDLRTRERGTPNAYVADARARWGALLGSRVELRVASSGVTVKALDGDDALVASDGRRASAPVFQPFSPPFEDVAPLAIDLDGAPETTTVGRVGSKAAGFAHLRRLFGPNSYTPKAIALPSSAYFAFVRSTGLDELISLTLKGRNRLPARELEARLTLVRATFEKAARLGLLERQAWYPALRQSLLNLRDATVVESIPGGGWDAQTACFRFRSSSNAEDLLGFTGAGLYESFTGCLQPPRGGPGRGDTVARAIARAWASLWGLKAFQERELRGIPHERVAMALLVHRNYPEAHVQGVAITPSRAEGVLEVASAPGEASITNPDGTFVGEEITAAFTNGCPAGALWSACPVSVFAREGKRSTPILQSQELVQLLREGARITEALSPSFPGASSASIRFDIEFKYLAPAVGQRERRLIIKQARPYVASPSAPSSAAR